MKIGEMRTKNQPSLTLIVGQMTATAILSRVGVTARPALLSAIGIIAGHTTVGVDDFHVIRNVRTVSP